MRASASERERESLPREDLPALFPRPRARARALLRGFILMGRSNYACAPVLIRFEWPFDGKGLGLGGDWFVTEGEGEFGVVGGLFLCGNRGIAGKRFIAYSGSSDKRRFVFSIERKLKAEMRDTLRCFKHLHGIRDVSETYSFSNTYLKEKKNLRPNYFFSGTPLYISVRFFFPLGC